MNISFIGLGIMGSRMAVNLLKNGVAVTVYNRSQAPVDDLKIKGAKAAASAREAAAGADIVFSMLSTPEVVGQVFLEEGGALSAMKKNAIWVDWTLRRFLSIWKNGRFTGKYAPWLLNGTLSFTTTSTPLCISTAKACWNYWRRRPANASSTSAAAPER